ncbi:MAG: glycosyltransferase [Verrucomicrobiae bacterium]
MSDTPTIRIIIPTKDRPRELKCCLDCLLPQLPSDGSCGVIVSEDGTSPTPSLPDSVTWMRAPGKGPGANRNFAGSRSKAEWLIFVDDDCLPGPGFLAAYRAAIAGVSSGSPVVLIGKTVHGEGPHDSLLWEAPGYGGSEPAPPSCNFAISRVLLEETGGFDERFRFTFEDMEFFARLRHTGVGFRFIPDALVEHPMRRIPSPVKLAARWESRVMSTHDLGASGPEILRLLPRHVAAVIVSRFRDPEARRDRFAAALRFLAEYLLFLFQLPRWIWKMKKARRGAFWERITSDGKAPPRFGL